MKIGEKIIQKTIMEETINFIDSPFRLMVFELIYNNDILYGPANNLSAIKKTIYDEIRE